ncbi:SID1 transmembrane family member 1-like isoform X2 [Leguminivora glycinivorella]|uniref:SID1 transmembrane family member 1-like isoform X2 n=1 Tax=Leguminivora glycinivorella TaxID=1035111 RepID=UPI00200FAFA0|nr:SID1 transmembrane family member 1-like isoform X2 [Leguminivora glycinivorella]
MAVGYLELYILFSYPIISLCQQNSGIVFNYNNTYKFDVEYTVNVSKNVEYIMEFAGDSFDTPARVTVASNFANSTFPLFVTARQQKDVSNQNTPLVHLTSSSPDPIEVTIVVETVKDFYIKLNTTTNITVTPSQPKYYFFPFKQEKEMDLKKQSEKRQSMCSGEEKSVFLENIFESQQSYSWFRQPKSVIVMIESDDDVCAVISIQNFSCPVFDNERNILYDGYYLTMTRRGGITLNQDMFPVGFYIVFIVKTSDEDCTGQISNKTLPTMARYLGWEETYVETTARTKNFTLRIIATISYQDYLIAAGAALGFFLCFYVAFIITVLYQRRKARQDAEANLNEAECISSPSTPHDADSVSIRRRHATPINVEAESSTQRLVGEGDRRDIECSSSSDTESDYSTLDDINREKDLRIMGRLCVANLARCRPRVLQARSKMYLWNVLTVAVFYTLPVIQLVVTYQRLLNQSGNADLCYFNSLCAHPLLALSDFNHVYSNLGYVVLGALFLAAVWRRHDWYQARLRREKELGIPQHFGLLYAMGIALVSEGMLSAAYHVCPNSMNFQFDTSFMYVTSVLCMVKIYQSRHPDINARAHATFGVLALIIFVGLVGVLNANVYFWVAFTILHLTTCLIMTFQIYYLGRFRLDSGVIYRATRELVSRPLAAITPTYVGRCVLLVIANLANWAIAAYGVAQHSRDFASHLLLVLMSNLFLYTLFYIVIKLLHRESIRWYSWVFIVLTYTTWFSSSYFYLDQITNWALTPAQSRQSNRPCSLLQLYDAHDIWHFMSSIAMFFSFNMYLTIDDNLFDTPRSEIMVF